MKINKKILSLSKSQLIIKRTFDIVFSIVILVLIAPLLSVITILLFLQNQGPILYRQKRYSYIGKSFYIYKFRTMSTSAIDEPIIQSTVNDDKRISRLGAFLRNTSLDELPQFFNVLKGDMSIVGPRPSAILFIEKYHEHLDYIMGMKPGITGWSQIHGLKGDSNLEMRVDYDFTYYNNWSLWFDLKIIFITTLGGFLHKNAY